MQKLHCEQTFHWKYLKQSLHSSLSHALSEEQWWLTEVSASLIVHLCQGLGFRLQDCLTSIKQVGVLLHWVLHLQSLYKALQNFIWG